MSIRSVWAWAGLLLMCVSRAEGLDATRLGVLYDANDEASRQTALYYSVQRNVPPDNLIALQLPDVAVIMPEEFDKLRSRVMDQLPTSVQSLLLVWSKLYAVGCMSITSAFAAGYRGEFCPTGCTRTPLNPLFNVDGWLPADTVGWWPAMLLPSSDPQLARSLIDRGVAADHSDPPGTLYLTRTTDTLRNVRAAGYAYVEQELAHRLHIVELSAPVTRDVPEVIGYFTGAAHVAEIPLLRFRPGAVADHLTSSGGVLAGGSQMSALAWIAQGATASYGSVSEPCNFPGKFPDVAVLFERYTRGETALEAYWKSVAMPGQGLFIGEPLSRPFTTRRR